MEREKSARKELDGVKLRRGVSLRNKCGNFNPLSGWEMKGEEESRSGSSNLGVSARKLGADLWEIQDVLGGNGKGAMLGDCSSVATTDRVSAYSQALTPTSSSNLKRKPWESRYSLNTSTELLKVLNRIWSLEEENTSNLSVVKTLKLELDHARSRIKELLQERQANKHEINGLVKHVMEDKLVKKNNERQKIIMTVQSLKDEVEAERRLRRHSESLHRKLTKELCEMKLSYSLVVKDLERQRRRRVLLEELGDEFAKGVVEYEQEVRELRQKYEKGHVRRHQRLVLHISEAWLDQRIQMVQAEPCREFSEKNTIADRLRCEIKGFLRARRTETTSSGVMTNKCMGDSSLQCQSLESLHMNGAFSAPCDADEDSMTTKSHCVELKMGTNDSHDVLKQDSGKVKERLEAKESDTSANKDVYHVRITSLGSSSTHTQFEEQNVRTSSSNGDKMQVLDERRVINDDHREESVRNNAQTVAPCEMVRDDGHLNKRCSLSCSGGDSRIFTWRSRSVKVGTDSTTDIRPMSSSVKHWKYGMKPRDDEASESSLKLPHGVKENTLKAKLLEARLEGQYARSRTSNVS